MSIYGTARPDNGPYTVQLDGGSISTYNATKYDNTTEALIYYADNLGPGPHSVKIVNQPALTGEVLSINFARVISPMRYFSPRHCSVISVAESLVSTHSRSPA